jgi:hypothetical protein
MCSGEQDALAGQLVEPRAGNVGVAVDTEISAQIVPVHKQHIVTALFCCLVVADYRHLLSRLSPVDPTGSGVSRVTALTNAAGIRRGLAALVATVGAGRTALVRRPKIRRA